MATTSKRRTTYIAERAVKTFIQVAIAVALAGLLGLIPFSVINIVGVAILAAILSVITSLIVYTTASKSSEFEANAPIDDGEH